MSDGSIDPAAHVVELPSSPLRCAGRDDNGRRAAVFPYHAGQGAGTGAGRFSASPLFTLDAAVPIIGILDQLASDESVDHDVLQTGLRRYDMSEQEAVRPSCG